MERLDKNHGVLGMVISARRIGLPVPLPPRLRVRRSISLR